MTALTPYGWWLDYHPRSALAFSSVSPIAAGAYYFEVSLDEGGADGTGGRGILFGICDRRTNLVGTVCSSVNTDQSNGRGGCFFTGNANNPFTSVAGWGSPVRANASGLIETVGTTGVYGIKLDTINHTIAVRNITDDSPAGTYVSDNWAAKVSGPVYILLGASHGTGATKGVGTVNFGASAFVASLPTSHVSIESVFPGAIINPADNSNIVLSNGNKTFAGTNVPVAFSPRPPGVAFDTNVGYHNACRSLFTIAQAA